MVRDTQDLVTLETGEIHNVLIVIMLTVVICHVVVTSTLSCKCCLLFLSSNSGNHGNKISTHNQVTYIQILQCC